MTGFADFHYPARWPEDRFGNRVKTGPPLSTLVVSDVFEVVSRRGGGWGRYAAVLSLERSDRRFVWVVLARVPSLRYGQHDGLDELQWYACSAGHVEVGLAHVDAGLDYPFHLWKKNGCSEMATMPSLPWNVWLAAGIGLRANGFVAPEARPYSLTPPG